jgi:hypothetical protein
MQKHKPLRLRVGKKFEMSWVVVLTTNTLFDGHLMVADLINLHFDICDTLLARWHYFVLGLFGTKWHSCNQLISGLMTAVLPLISARVRLIPTTDCSNCRLNAAASALLLAFQFLSTFKER